MLWIWIGIGMALISQVYVPECGIGLDTIRLSRFL